MLVSLLDRIARLMCRHEWIRERQDNGRLAQRCLHCLKRRDHTLLKLIEWKVDYEPICPSHPAALPPPLPWAMDAPESKKPPGRAA